MALKRLDEEFELKPGTQLLPYMKRLLPSLEGRFQSIEGGQETYQSVLDELREVGLKRINELLIPATQDILEVTKLGFLLGPSSTSVKLELGLKTWIIDEGPQRDTFTPSPYVLVERRANIDDYAIARVTSYDQITGALVLDVTAWHGNQGPHTDWVISSTPGMADSAKLYHDAIAPMHTQVEADAVQVAADRVAVQTAADALFAAGLDAQSFIRKDGAIPFLALQIAVHPPVGANDAYIPTTAWTRARMIEYSSGKMNRAGDTMTGPLLLSGAPTQSMQAATKAYVDAIIGQGGIVNGMLTIQTVNPTLRLQATGTQQHRMIEARSSSSITRWVLTLADTALESGGNQGSNFALYRYNDGGAYLDTPLQINRVNGFMYTKALNYQGGLSGTGDCNIVGDFWAYRGASPTTGVIFLNSARNAYLYMDGGTYQLPNFPLSVGGNISGGNIYGGHINCYSIYTQGYGITCWGYTSHGASTVNGQMYINGNLRLYGAGSNYLEFYDSDWGPMYIHHNGDVIGFLNNGAGWCAYFTNAGHVWTAQYGWVHDYINNQANAYAWSAANYRWDEANRTFVRETRKPYAGDPYALGNQNNVWEPYWGAVMTGWLWWQGQQSPAHYRMRYDQVNINGGWYTTRYD
jgi:hypothetical protein